MLTRIIHIHYITYVILGHKILYAIKLRYLKTNFDTCNRLPIIFGGKYTYHIIEATDLDTN